MVSLFLINLKKGGEKMGRREEALEKIHSARLKLIEKIETKPSTTGIGETLKAKAETLTILEKCINDSFNSGFLTD